MNETRNAFSRIKAYPWTTDYLQTQAHLYEDLADVDAISSFAFKITGYEKLIYEEHGQVALAVRAYLDEEAKPYHGEAQPNASSLITSYRLLEVMAERSGKTTVRREARRVIPPLGFQSQFLKDFGENLSDIKDLLGTFKLAAETISRRADPFMPTSNHLLNHLLQLDVSSSELNATFMERNLLCVATAITVNNMRLKVSRADTTKCPQRLCSTEALVDGDFLTNLSTEDRSRLLKACKILNIRRPMELATHISTLALLLPRDWSKKRPHYSEEHIIQLAMVLGNHDISLLQSIEHEIWSAVLSIAQGNESGKQAILTLSERLPWDEIEKIDEDHAINRRFRIIDQLGGTPKNGISFSIESSLAPFPVPNQAEQEPWQVSEAHFQHRDENLLHEEYNSQVLWPQELDTGRGQLEEEVEIQEEVREDDEVRMGQEARMEEARMEVVRMEEAARKDEEARMEVVRMEEAARKDEEARMEVVRMEEAARKDEEARMEEAARKDEEARMEVVRMEEAARKDEEARMEEAARKEAAREKALKEAAAREETARKEAARKQQEAANQQPRQPLQPWQPVAPLPNRRETRSMLAARDPQAGTQAESSPNPGHTNCVTKTKQPAALNKKRKRKRPVKPQTYTNRHTAQAIASQAVKTAQEIFSESSDIQIQPDKPVNDLDLEQEFHVIPIDEEWQFYDAAGNGKNFTPNFHSESVHKLWQDIYNLIQESYVDNIPRHVGAQEDSVIRIVTEQQRKTMSAREWQNVLRKFHVLELLERPTKSLSFDLEGLEFVGGSLTKPIIVHDLSQGEKGNERHRKFTLEGMHAIKDSLRAVNAISLPCSCAVLSADIGHAATNLRAYRHRVYCPEKTPDGRDRMVPITDLEWFLVALLGAQHEGHVDAEGASTIIECLVGYKLWVVFRPVDLLADQVPFARTGVINWENLNNLSLLIKNGWILEALLLKPGERFYMRPNTPHAVLTLSNSICIGGHFFSLTTMQEHFVGMVTTLVDDDVTNTEHQPFRHLIRLIVQYTYHALVHGEDWALPKSRHAMDPENMDLDDLQDLLAVIYTGILCNAIDPLTYDLSTTSTVPINVALAQMELYDSNNMPEEDRAGCSLARSCAYELRNWLCHHFYITGPEGSTTAQIVDYTIAHQASVIYSAYLAAPYDGSRKGFTAELIKKQLLMTFDDKDPVKNLVDNHLKEINRNNAANRPMFVSTKNWTMTKLAVDDYQPLPKDKMMALGVSPNDKRYYAGVETFLPVTAADLNQWDTVSSDEEQQEGIGRVPKKTRTG